MKKLISLVLTLVCVLGLVGCNNKSMNYIIENKPSARVDKTLLESSPNKVLVRNAASIKIASDVTPELILDRLVIENCAKVSCNEEQESAIAAIAQNVAKIGGADGEELSGMVGGIKDLLSTKMVNADSYIM